MSSATYRNQEIDWEDIDVDDLDFEDYMSAYGEGGVSASYLNRPLADQAQKDREIRDYREGTLLEPLNWFSEYVARDGDTPDYDSLLEEIDLDDEDWQESLENHAAAEGYEL